VVDAVLSMVLLVGGGFALLQSGIVSVSVPARARLRWPAHTGADLRGDLDSFDYVATFSSSNGSGSTAAPGCCSSPTS
jgi:hypothetical protein